MKYIKLFCILLAIIGLLAIWNPTLAGANDAQGFRNLYNLWKIVDNHEEERKRKERQEEQDRIQREYLEQRRKEVQQQEERNLIERERLQEEQRKAEAQRRVNYERRYWETQGESTPQPQSTPEEIQETNTPEKKIEEPPKTEPANTPVLKAVIGKIGKNTVLYNVPAGLSWNPNPCVVRSYESTACASCLSGYKTQVTLQTKEIRQKCLQANPQFGPLGDDQNYEIK